LRHQICYAVKPFQSCYFKRAQPPGAGFDLVSGGELARVKPSADIRKSYFFQGVGKQTAEIKQLFGKKLRASTWNPSPSWNICKTLAQEHGTLAPIALRINPDIDALTHPYIGNRPQGQ